MDPIRAPISPSELKKATNCETRFLGRMIRNLDPIEPTSIIRSAPYSSLGHFSCLPIEILVMILEYLDFQSLSRLSQSSLRGKEVIENLAAYQEMMEHAPETLAALGKTGLLKFHSSTLLRQILRSKECVSCRDFGAFLLLPTCQRACFECLDRNTGLRMMRLSDAKSLFGLSNSQINELPILKTIPGEYSIRNMPIIRKRSLRLVNVWQAKQLAIDTHGSVEALENFSPAPPPAMKHKAYATLMTFYNASLEMPGSDMSKLQRQVNQSEDYLGGMATIRFPFLSPDGPDVGRLCRGCEVSFNCYRHGELPARVSAALSTPANLPYEPLRAAVSRLHTEPDFLDHIRSCYGVARLHAQREDTESP